MFYLGVGEGGGVEGLTACQERSPEKKHLTTCKQSLACLACNPSWARIHSDETSDLELSRLASLTTQRGPPPSLSEKSKPSFAMSACFQLLLTLMTFQYNYVNPLDPIKVYECFSFCWFFCFQIIWLLFAYSPSDIFHKHLSSCYVRPSYKYYLTNIKYLLVPKCATKILKIGSQIKNL